MANILLADDDRSTLDLVRRALELDGHRVTTADDGLEALACLENAGPFDLLLTDVEMPGLDGVSLARRALTVAPGTRIILMSAFADVADTADSLGDPTARGLAKPFTIERIRSEVRAILGA